MVIPHWHDYDKLFKDAEDKYGAYWKWLKAIALNESMLGNERRTALGIKDPTNIDDSVSKDGLSWGLMQMRLRTAKGLDMLATPEKLNNTAYSIDLSGHYIGQLRMVFSPLDLRYIEWVIKSYNQGPSNTKKEQSGLIMGYAHNYWDRFQRNLKMIEANP